MHPNMMHVIPPGAERAASLQHAADHQHHGVQHWQPQHPQDREGRRWRYGGAAVRELDREPCQQRAQHHASGVAHEHGRLVAQWGAHVVAEKADRDGEQDDEVEGHRLVADDEGAGDEPDDGGRGEAGREAVGAVGHVDRVDEADDREYGEGQGQGAEADVPDPQDIAHMRDVDAARQHDEQGCDGLDEELGLGADVEEVVEYADHDQQGDAAEDVEADQGLGFGELYAEDERDCHAEAADEGDFAVVLLAAAGAVYQADPPGGLDQHLDHGQGQQQRHDGEHCGFGEDGELGQHRVHRKRLGSA